MPLGEKPRVIGAITIRFARRSERKAKGEKRGAIRSSINRPFDRISAAVPRRSAATAVCARSAFRRGPSRPRKGIRSEEHTSELQSLMRISYAVFCLKKKNRSEHIQTAHMQHNN